jgi:hypothetical protein
MFSRENLFERPQALSVELQHLQGEAFCHCADSVGRDIFKYQF